MERPTKPVMWTDEEGISRLVKWIDVNIKRLLEKYYTWNSLIDMVVFNSKITADSLLHDLNIIKPVGRLEYTSEWIDKILSGQKTMSIRKTQYQCAYYELSDTDKEEVRGIVEVDGVQMWHTVDLIGMVVDFEKLSLSAISGVEAYVNRCGFNSKEEFAEYHRTNFQSIKYAITYRVVDMKGDGK